MKLCRTNQMDRGVDTSAKGGKLAATHTDRGLLNFQDLMNSLH